MEKGGQEMRGRGGGTVRETEEGRGQEMRGMRWRDG